MLLYPSGLRLTTPCRSLHIAALQGVVSAALEAPVPRPVRNAAKSAAEQLNAAGGVVSSAVPDLKAPGNSVAQTVADPVKQATEEVKNVVEELPVPPPPQPTPSVPGTPKMPESLTPPPVVAQKPSTPSGPVR